MTKRRTKHTPKTRCTDRACQDCFMSDGQPLDTWGMDYVARVVGERAPRGQRPAEALRLIRTVVSATGRKPQRMKS